MKAENMEMQEYWANLKPKVWKCKSIKRNASRKYGNVRVLSEMQAENMEMQEY